MKLIPGWATAELAAGAVVRVEARGRGPAGRAVLAAPLVVRLEGPPLRLRVAGLELRIAGASLSPDGRVELAPAGPVGARRLRLAGHLLTAWVRRRPAVAAWLTP